MALANSVVSEAADREIVTKRVFDAPPELVFSAWTDSKCVAEWYGPRGFTTTIHEMDVRPGGVWRFTMHGPDGVEYPNKIVFEEVAAPERLVYTHGSDGDDQGGNHVAPFHVTVTFEDKDGKTALTMRALFATAAERERVVREFGAIEGAEQTLERLGAQLEKMSKHGDGSRGGPR